MRGWIFFADGGVAVAVMLIDDRRCAAFLNVADTAKGPSGEMTTVTSWGT